MILFFADGECESDAFVRHCYAHYADIVNAAGGSLPGSVGIVREEGKKPRFDCDEVHFSLSHSHGVIMLGISRIFLQMDGAGELDEIHGSGAQRLPHPRPRGRALRALRAFRGI